MDLYKKSNKLNIKLKSDTKISIKEIASFEKYINKRFQIENVKTEIEYSIELNPDDEIKTDWKDIVSFMGEKFPLTKAILINSELEIEGTKINVNLAVKGKEILHSRDFDKALADVLEELYGKKYTVSYNENISEEQLKSIEETIREEEKKAIKQMQVNVEAPKNQEVKGEPQNENSGEEAKTPLIYGREPKVKSPLIKIKDLSPEEQDVSLDGEIFGEVTTRETQKGKILIKFKLYDGSSTIECKLFSTKEKSDNVMARLQEAKGIRIDGKASLDPFAREIGVLANTVIETAGMKKEKRMDNAEHKRVELHMHTQMSQMDAVTPCSDLIKRAVSWGWKSIAITDHGVVQAFPDAHKYLGKSKADIKVIYGVEAYLVPDKDNCVAFPKGQSLDTEYCVLDIETTGLSFRTEKITEIGIMKYKNGEVIDEFECFVNPEKPIPTEVVNITHITDDMVKDAETIDKVLPKVMEFIGDSVLVAHNADFDIPFIKYNCAQYGLELNNTYIDTLRLAKDLFPDYKKYKLGIIADNLGITVEVAHRALDDVDTLVKVFRVMLKMLSEKGVKKLEDIDRIEAGTVDFKKLPSYHAIILAKNYVGLKNLYKLISYSHLNYFYKKPRILKSLYKKYSEGLILGSACQAGELYSAILAGKTDEEIEKIAADYDYLEIQPNGNNMNLVRSGKVQGIDELKDINKKIIVLGDKLNKLVVATCDVHFMDPQDEIYRRILLARARL